MPKDFVHHLTIVNTAEVDLGKLAVERGTAEEVKKFARMMVDDHTASGDKLKALASDLRVEPKAQAEDAQRDQQEKLEKLSGADFDREYASAMVDSHKDLIDQLEPRVDKKTLDQWKLEMNGKTKVARRIRRPSSGQERESDDDASQSVRCGPLPDGVRAPGSRQGAQRLAGEALRGGWRSGIEQIWLAALRETRGLAIPLVEERPQPAGFDGESHFVRTREAIDRSRSRRTRADAGGGSRRSAASDVRTGR